MAGVTVLKPIPHGENPMVKSVARVRHRYPFKSTKVGDRGKFALERECRNPTQDQADDEKDQHDAESAEGRRVSNGGIGAGRLWVHLDGEPIVSLRSVRRHGFSRAPGLE